MLDIIGIRAERRRVVVGSSAAPTIREILLRAVEGGITLNKIVMAARVDDVLRQQIETFRHDPGWQSFFLEPPRERGRTAGELAFQILARLALSATERALDPKGQTRGMRPELTLGHCSSVKIANRNSLVHERARQISTGFSSHHSKICGLPFH
ncbi:hypothetical protein [Methylobacterium sp. Leaf118]|uniref:hypothetical protein n=1 Tax=Methylobacterium sp. Leaf118 TaxID=2876562 RepID=UPI001E49AC42|nr:hypothetical protein [Methylobacterium sp. Leaf118]